VLATACPPRRLCAAEAVKQAWQVLARDGGAGVLDGDADFAPALLQSHRDLAAAVCVADGIAEQVGQARYSISRSPTTLPIILALLP